MRSLPEPDDVDFFIDSTELDPQASAEMNEAIKAYKRRPEYRFEREEAERTLAEVGINFREYGMQNAQSLLEHWHRCVADLTDAGPTENPEANGQVEPDEGGNVGHATDRSREGHPGLT